MKARRCLIAPVGAALLLSLWMAACGGLPRDIRSQIDSEKAAIVQAEWQLQHSQKALQEDLDHSPDLFRGAPVATEWPARLQAAKGKLEGARNDLKQLDNMSGNDPQSVRRARQLLTQERSLRQSVISESQSVESDAASWLDFERNVPHYLAAMQQEYDGIHAVDLTPVSQAVAKAEQDWPAKKGDLDNRLAALHKSSDDADAQWNATAAARQDAAAGKARGPELASLIEANDALRRDENNLRHGADDLRAASGQLYDSWDKILADLEVSSRGADPVYREKVTTVRTHYTDVAAKKTETSTDTEWVDVPEPAYRSVENDLGMAIAHKDAGLFDSEARTQPQPPGFAYIASPSQGSNQYGYWSHSGGQTVWTFLPQYLILRELLWGRSYQPIYVNEYNGYSTALRAGRTYYGRETPASPPKYGSHGTFTTRRYASSRYVQSGGYSGSAYASNRSARPSRVEPREGEPRFGSREEPGVGKRFGGSSSGQRFGSGSGRRFGSPRSSPRLPGRVFGRRR